MSKANGSIFGGVVLFAYGMFMFALFPFLSMILAISSFSFFSGLIMIIYGLVERVKANREFERMKEMKSAS
jgi:hypothetical protein